MPAAPRQSDETVDKPETNPTQNTAKPFQNQPYTCPKSKKIPSINWKKPINTSPRNPKLTLHQTQTEAWTHPRIIPELTLHRRLTWPSPELTIANSNNPTVKKPQIKPKIQQQPTVVASWLVAGCRLPVAGCQCRLPGADVAGCRSGRWPVPVAPVAGCRRMCIIPWSRNMMIPSESP